MSHSEEWRPIPSLPEYEASSLGRVRRLPAIMPMPGGRGIRRYGGQPMLGVRDDEGRPTLTFRRKNYRISRRVCEAFHGPPPFSRAVVMHGDDDPANNVPGNLSWGTQKENLSTPRFRDYCRARLGPLSPRAKWLAKRST